MALNRSNHRGLRLLVAFGFVLPLCLGQRCMTPPEDDSSTQTNTNTGFSPLVVDAGTDRTATVGMPISLQAAVSGGDGNYTIAWQAIEGLSDVRSLSPEFQSDIEGDHTLELTVTDGTGQSSRDSLQVSVSQITTLASLRWGSNYSGEGYQVVAEFTKALDPGTAERITNYATTADRAMPAGAVLQSDRRTVLLVFDHEPLTRSTAFDISVGSGILDVNGAAVPSTRNIVPSSNANDTTKPTVSIIRWGVNYAGSYAVEVVFSEVMDRTSTESAGNYMIRDGLTQQVAYNAVLSGDGRTLTLIFDGKALSSGARLDVGLAPIRDINGLTLTPLTDQAIAGNVLDIDPPGIVAEGVRFVGEVRDGFKVSIEFNEAMDKTSTENPALYRVDGQVATSVQLAGDGHTAIVSFALSTASTNSLMTITGGQVRDVNGLALPAQTDLPILPSVGRGPNPSAPDLTWLPGAASAGYQILVRFNEAMDKTSVEDVTNWRITGTNVRPNDVRLSHQTIGNEIASRTAILTFDDFDGSPVRLGRSSRIDVSVGDSILDIEGNALGQVSLPVLASQNDLVPPAVIAPAPPQGFVGVLTAQPVFGDITGWVDLTAVTYDGSRYYVSVVFSETMDADTTGLRASYTLAGKHPTRVTINGQAIDGGPLNPDIATGRVVLLEFEVAADAIALTDKLLISVNVRDINGRATTSALPLSISPNPIETLNPTAPLIAQDAGGNEEIFWDSNAAPYTVIVKFDQVMDQTSVANVEAYRLDGVKPTASTRLASDGKAVSLVFGTGTFDPTLADQLVLFGGMIRSINGVPYGVLGVNTMHSVQQRPAIDMDSPAAVRAMWAADPFDYRLTVTFNESLDNTVAETLALYSLSNGSTAVSATLLDGGTDVLVVFGGGAVPAGTATTLIMTGIPLADMHGNTAGGTSLDILKNPVDGTAVPLEPIQAVWAADYGSQPDETGYRLRTTFSVEMVDGPTAVLPANYRFPNVIGANVIPTQAELADTDILADGVFAGRTVTLTFGNIAQAPLATADTLDISVGGSILDLNGNAFAALVGQVVAPNPADVTAPEVFDDGVPMDPTDDVVDMGFGRVMFSFTEAMDRDSAETLTNYQLRDIELEPPFAVPDDIVNAVLVGTPVGANLAGDGKTVTLQFTVDVADAPPPVVDPIANRVERTLRISVGGRVTDINLNPAAEVDYVMGTNP